MGNVPGGGLAETFLITGSPCPFYIGHGKRKTSAHRRRRPDRDVISNFEPLMTALGAVNKDNH